MSKWKTFLNWYRGSWLFSLSWLFLAVCIVGVILDQFILPWYVKLGEEIEMPDVIEMNLSEATGHLEQRGFKVLVKDSLYDANHPEGTVIEQNPYPYATVKEGRRVYLSISIGEKPIIMPNLFGVSPREAELILDTYDLKLRAKNYVYSDLYHEGTVMGQSYPQGQEIKAGSSIDITISLGNLQEERLVPDLIGKSLYEARQRLRAAKLKLGEVSYQERDNILPETVLSQSLQAGSKYDEESVIDLTVSKEKQ